MNRLFYFLFLSVLIACKDKPNASDKTEVVKEDKLEAKASKFPSALDSIFIAHGGLEHWGNKKTLEYILKKGSSPEKHTIDLKNRKDKIEFSDYSMGFDGQEVWILDPNKKYEGDAVFYHNLMFYFYAMPFVLGDPGIVYSEADILDFEDKKYPGIRISYKTGVGTSPKDEYYLHYDPDTYQMQWLGYTVTYRSGEKSDNVKWIRYEDWMTTDGLLLPKSLSWYSYEGRTIKELKSTLSFEEVRLSETGNADSFYAKPIGAINPVAKTP